MRTQRTSFRTRFPKALIGRIAIGLTAGLLACPVAAGEASSRPGRGLTEIPDPELNLMRGRYTIGNNQVAWFGVSMISTWQTASGQTLHSTMKLGMDFSTPGQTPTITFTPSVNITAANAPLPVTPDGLTRSVDSAGLANVSGLVQSVQVAGDSNTANNVTQLNVRNGTSGGPGPGSGMLGGGTVSTQIGGTLASASFDGAAARVLLQVEGQGAVEQWIRSGSLGQTIALTSDNQQVSNRLEIELVRQTLAANTQLVQNVAQAIAMTRGIGGPPGF